MLTSFLDLLTLKKLRRGSNIGYGYQWRRIFPNLFVSKNRYGMCIHDTTLRLGGINSQMNMFLHATISFMLSVPVWDIYGKNRVRLVRAKKPDETHPRPNETHFYFFFKVIQKDNDINQNIFQNIQHQ